MKHARSLAIAIGLAWSGSALAQSDRELATRQELLTQAEELSDKGNHADALALAKRAEAIKITTSLRLFLAGEQSAVGLLADAYGNSRQCVVEAQANDRLNDRDRILAACEQLEQSLGKRVGRVTLRLPTPVPPDVHVSISGEEINAALLGAPCVVSPGRLAIAITAPGYLRYASTVDVAEGASVEVDAHLVPDPSLQPCLEGQERVRGDCVDTRAASPAASPAGLSTRQIAGLVVGGVGLVVTGVGAYFGATALSKNSDSAPYCGVGGAKDACYGPGVSLRSDAVTDATISTVLIGVGAAAVVGGVVLWFTAPSSKAAVNVGFDGRTWHVGGTF